MLFAIIFCALAVVFAVYRCYFDGLSQIPGPKLVALQPLWLIHKFWTQRTAQSVEALHRKHGSVVRTGPSEISFSTHTAYNSIYGPLCDKHVTKSGSLQGLFVTLATDHTPSTIIKFEKKSHREDRGDFRPIFDEMVRGPQESFHHDVFNKHLIDPSKLTGDGSLLNLSSLLDELLWDLAGEGVLGHAMPARAKVAMTKFMEAIYLGPIIIECCTYVIGRSLFQRIVHAITAMPEWFPTSGFSILKASRFLDYPGTKPRDLESTHFNFLDSLTSGKSGLHLTPSQVGSNVVMLAGAAFETSTAATNIIFYFMLRDPAIFRALREELKSAFKTREGISDHKLITLPYLNACINEGLRVKSPATGKMMQRISLGTTIDGIYVPKGVAVSADIFSMHRSPLYWKDPESFRPERWIDKESTDDFRAFRPFSTGPRACPGRTMALQSARLTVSKLVWLYDMEMITDPIEWEQSAKCACMWSLPDLHIRVTSSGLP